MLEYIDEATGRKIITHSMLKTMRRCPRQFMYKYADRLKPRIGSKPLERGKWIHALLEAFYIRKQYEQDPEKHPVIDQDGNRITPPTWQEVHEQWTRKFQELFEEEREVLGDLPREVARLMRSYVWHYSADEEWEIIEIEWTIDVPFGKEFLYRGRADLLVRNSLGLWLVDHKSHKTLPGHLQRLLDAQSGLYLWAARRAGYDVQGFIWNYLRTKAPSIPELVDQHRTPRLTKRKLDTDYLTYAGAIKRYGLDPAPYRHELRRLKAQRYDPEATMQTSEFFRRVTMEKDDEFLHRVALEAMKTTQRADRYNWAQRDAVERNPDRSCGWMCSYPDLCTTELFGGNADNVRRSQFKIGDPLDYYEDQKDRTEERGGM